MQLSYNAQEEVNTALDFRPDSPVPVLPVEIEEELLGGILLDPDILPEVEDLPVAAFSISSHRLIYKAMREVKEAGRKPDGNTVAHHLQLKGNLKEAGGKSKLADLHLKTLHSGNVKQYADLLKENFQRRNLSAKLTKLASLVNTNADLGSAIHQLKDQLAQIEQGNYKNPDERLKLELQMLLQESDPIKIARRKGEIASHHRLSKICIEQLLDGLKEQFSTPQHSISNWNKFFSQGTEALDWIIPGILPSGETVLLAAQAKCGKTALATDIIHAVLSGNAAIGEQVGVKGRVLLITSDESPNSTKRRLILRGVDLLEERHNMHFMTNLDITNLSKLEEVLENLRPHLVVIDSLTTICAKVKVSEKDAEFARYLYQLKNLLGSYGAAGIVTHHDNKDSLAKGIDKVSGSARIPAAVWGIWQIKAVDPNNDQDPRRWLKVKPREGEAVALNLKMNPKDLWASKGIFDFLGEVGDESGEKRTHGERVLALLAKYAPNGLEFKEIDAALQVGRTLYSVLDRLEDRRLVTRRRSTTDATRWVYALPERGDSPPPSVDPTSDSKSPETPTDNSFEVIQQLFSTHSAVIQQAEKSNEVLNAQELVIQSNSALIQQNDALGGGGGVTDEVLNNSDTVKSDTLSEKDEDVLPSLANEPLKVDDRVRINSPGVKHHGKTATIKRLKKEGKLQLADLAVDREGFRHWEAELSWLERLT